MLPEVDVAAVRRAVRRWASGPRRQLPWRGERDPYRVHVAEVMLQQTQVTRVAPAYTVFLTAFPTVEALAAARDTCVLRAWGDLGYPRRALYLWRAARTVVDAGGYPSQVAELERLPGVGPYTARAIASFAFSQDVGVVEANIRRLLRRMCGSDHLDEQALADALVPPGLAASWNQALMDLGAEVCRPRVPRCDRCPLRRSCAWSAGVRAPTQRRERRQPFAETMRFARGRVMRELRAASPLSMAELVRRTGLGAERTGEAVASLAADELATSTDDRVSLGAAPSSGSGGSQRARERRRETSATT